MNALKRGWLVLFAYALSLLLAFPVMASGLDREAALPPPPTGIAGLPAGNYCLSCHMPGDPRLETVTSWAGTTERDAISPCPAAIQVHDDFYTTERILLAIDRLDNVLPDTSTKQKANERLVAYTQSYNRLLDSQVTSLEAFTSDAQLLRFRLGKVYTQLTQAEETVKRQRILLFAGLASLFVLISLGWGYANAQKEIGSGGGWRRSLRWPFALGIIAIFALFSLPIFRMQYETTTETSAEAQARQTVLDTAQRLADRVDQAQARAWMLARVGAAWNDLDTRQAQTAWQSGITSASQAQLEQAALWGQSQSVQEVSVKTAVDLDKAALVVDQIQVARERNWGLPLMAHEWSRINPKQAEALLQEALTSAENSRGFYRDLDLRLIAVTWAEIVPEKGLQIAGQVQDPALRAWGLREIAAGSGEADLYQQAAEAARQVSDPVQRARSLREIGEASGQSTFFEEALQALSGVEGAPLAYALSDLAAVSDEGIGGLAIDQIPAAYPDARAAALYRIGEYQLAWEAASQISDPYERARAQATIAAAWGNPQVAAQIEIPVLRDRALRLVAVQQKDPSLVGRIASPYERVMALTSLGQLQAALKASDELKETSPLAGLAIALYKKDPQTALQLVDKMEREMDKAEALRAIASLAGDEQTFERALGMALAARQRGDSLSPAQASFQLALVFEPFDPGKATQAFAQALQVLTGKK